MSNEIELEPCPFPHEVKRGVFLEIDAEELGFVRGACSDCGCAGPYIPLDSEGGATRAEKAEAARLWNTRAAAAQIEALRGEVEGLRKALEEIAETPNAGWIIARATLAKARGQV